MVRIQPTSTRRTSLRARRPILPNLRIRSQQRHGTLQPHAPHNRWLLRLVPIHPLAPRRQPLHLRQKRLRSVELQHQHRRENFSPNAWGAQELPLCGVKCVVAFGEWGFRGPAGDYGVWWGWYQSSCERYRAVSRVADLRPVAAVWCEPQLGYAGDAISA